MAEIVLEGVTKRFAGGQTAVREASFTIGAGELFVLVGPSGCGKSTLLNMIVGLETPSEGEIRVDGRRVNEIDPRERNMAMVFQSYALYPHMTVRENIAFPLRLARRPAEEIRRRVDSVAERLQLTELLDRKPATLSGGQRQRVAMGRAIVREPVAFLMDEPLSNLDARLRVEMRTEIARLQRRLGVTTVYVTHDQTEAMTLGHRLAVLRDGVVQQIGTPRELYEAPANLFVAGFIGLPAMNFLPGEIEGERLRLPVGDVGLRRPPGEASGRVVAGIRPEHLVEAPRSADEEAPRFKAAVEVIEWMGSEAWAHVELAAHGDGPMRLVCRLDAGTTATEGAEIELRLDPQKLHLFEAETGRRLARRT